MKIESDLLRQEETFDLMNEKDLPKDTEVLSSRFVYALKRSGKRKARLVVGGHVQFATVLEINSSPTVSPTSLRIFLAWTVDLGLNLVRIGFDGAYLNSTLPDPVYIRLPQVTLITLTWKLRKG